MNGSGSDLESLSPMKRLIRSAMTSLSPLCIHAPSKGFLCQFRNWCPTLQQTQRISVYETSKYWLQIGSNHSITKTLWNICTISTHVGRRLKLWYNLDMSQSGDTFDPNVQLFTKSIGETLQQKLGSSLKGFSSLTLLFSVLMGCTSNHDISTPEPTSLRISPNELQNHPSNETLQTLILQGNGTLSNQSWVPISQSPNVAHRVCSRCPNDS